MRGYLESPELSKEVSFATYFNVLSFYGLIHIPVISSFNFVLNCASYMHPKQNPTRNGILFQLSFCQNGFCFKISLFVSETKYLFPKLLQ